MLRETRRQIRVEMRKVHRGSNDYHRFTTISTNGRREVRRNLAFATLRQQRSLLSDVEWRGLYQISRSKLERTRPRPDWANIIVVSDERIRLPLAVPVSLTRVLSESNTSVSSQGFPLGTSLSTDRGPLTRMKITILSIILDFHAPMTTTPTDRIPGSRWSQCNLV